MTFNPWRRREQLDHTELVWLLPAPGDPVLSPDRQLLLEDYLMNEIRQAIPEPSLSIARQVKDKRKQRKRLAWRLGLPAAVLAAVAGTVAAVVINTEPAPAVAPTMAACAPELSRNHDALALVSIEDGETPEQACANNWKSFTRDVNPNLPEKTRAYAETVPTHLVGCTSPQGDGGVTVYPRPQDMTDEQACTFVGLVRPDDGPVYAGASAAQVRKLQHLIDTSLGAEGRTGPGDGCASYTATRSAVQGALEELDMDRWRIEDQRTSHSDTADVWYSLRESTGTVVLRSGDDVGHCTPLTGQPTGATQ
ncbi:hypothetical protein [Streptomyces sp. NBC_00233]|uniref:hypothetical protein n=1 Tax=Streptomyces sp. NBC_00233 TaxID=2975686 RepID=UPI0022548516|nr:hypothetical protein [Streptomyces sp. NBC_00233]MCX5233070.1 hypothetical protein [Streptomyces sp. NBC_00233]